MSRTKRNRGILGALFGAVVGFGVVGFAGPAEAHGGGLNRCGCHFNRSTGECHCHQPSGCGCECEPSHCG